MVVHGSSKLGMRLAFVDPIGCDIGYTGGFLMISDFEFGVLKTWWQKGIHKDVDYDWW